MELKKALEQVQKNSLKLSKEDLTVKDNSISIYGKGEVSAEVLGLGTIALKKAFPRLSKDWYDILEECLDDVGFTDERFIQAIKSLIMTCQYPEPTIANLTGFDRRVKLFTYNQTMTETKEFSPQMRKRWYEDHPRVKLKDEVYYIAKSDYNNYKHLFEVER